MKIFNLAAPLNNNARVSVMSALWAKSCLRQRSHCKLQLRNCAWPDLVRRVKQRIKFFLDNADESMSGFLTGLVQCWWRVRDHFFVRLTSSSKRFFDRGASPAIRKFFIDVSDLVKETEKKYGKVSV